MRPSEQVFEPQRMPRMPNIQTVPRVVKRQLSYGSFSVLLILSDSAKLQRDQIVKFNFSLRRKAW